MLLSLVRVSRRVGWKVYHNTTDYWPWIVSHTQPPTKQSQDIARLEKQATEQPDPTKSADKARALTPQAAVSDTLHSTIMVS